MTTLKNLTMAAMLALTSAPLALTLAPSAALAQQGGGGGGGGAGAGGGSSNDIYDVFLADAQRNQPRAYARAEPNNTVPPRLETPVVNKCSGGRQVRVRDGGGFRIICTMPR